MGNSSSFETIFECHDFNENIKRRLGTDAIPRCMADPDSEDEGSFDETYEVDLTSSLGAGKFSVVHPCWRRSQPEKQYAIKIINTLIAESASMKQIQDEIEILEMMGGHPGLVELIESDQSMPNCIRLVMEICEGGELYDRIQKTHHFQEGESRTVVRNLLDATAYIHSKGVIHRDLKPENILLVSRTCNTDIKISDFGLAKVSREFPMKLPRANSICGSDFYLAPEIIKQQEYGREVDIWAVGVITYIILSGSLPFFSTVLHKLYRQIVERDLNFAEKPWRTVSKGAQDFVLKLLQVRPGDRPTAADSLNHPWVFDANSQSARMGRQPLVSTPSQPAVVNNFAPLGPSKDSHYSATHQLEHAHKVGSRRPIHGMGM